MSDCSTNAWKTPACPEHKTCGNCGHSCGHRTKLHGCTYDYVPCMLHGTFEHEANRCSDWVERAEQRYERLAQVAVELVEIIGFIRQPVDPVLNVKMARIRHELEALGVSVDE